MRTALVTTAYLDTPERFGQTLRFVIHYEYKCPNWDLIILDNASDPEVVQKFRKRVSINTTVLSFSEHHGRPSHLDYLYLWRALYKLKDFFAFYDKIVYMDNDFFILSDRMLDYVNELTSGWTTFWSPTYKMPETGCHIIVKDDPTYLNFVKSGDYTEHNGTMMELTLPCTVNHDFKGDRYGEWTPLPEITEDMDYWAQGGIPSFRNQFIM